MLGHLVVGRLFSKDLEIGKTLTTVANKTLTVNEVKGKLLVVPQNVGCILCD